METKTLKILEFPKIIQMLVERTTNAISATAAEKLTPYDNAADVEKQLTLAKEAADMLVKRSSPRIGGLVDLTTHIKRAQMGGILNITELLNVGDCLKIARNLVSYHRESETAMAIDEYFSAIAYDRDLEQEISETIVGEDIIADNASPQLLSIRRSISHTHERIRESLSNIIRSTKYQKALQEQIITIRDGRYVVPIKAESKSEVPGIVHDMSSSGATYFIEPQVVVEQNNHLRELHLKEQLEIERILAALTEKVHGVADMLMSNQAAIAELDFIFAKGKLALTMDAIKPEVNESGIVDLIKARHPLLDKRTIVPISLNLGQDFTSLVITGPNTGGKTVALKTVGLLSIMAASGLLIPAAEGSQVSLFDDIFADIGDEQSIEQSLSTFSSHMTNIVHIVSSVTPQSLVLLDELGAGTDPTEGAALSIAILKYLHSNGCRIVATTHYSEIKLYALSTPGVTNAACEFDVVSMKPTYRILIGIPGKSNAFAISKRLGLPEFIINNATEHLSRESISFEDVINKLESDRRKAELEKEETNRRLLEIEKLRDQADKEREALARERANVAANAGREAKRIIDNAKREVEQMLDELKAAQKAAATGEYQTKLHEAKHKLVKKQKESDQATVVQRPRNMKQVTEVIVGMSVHVADLGMDATVLSLPSESGDVKVQAGIMKITTNIANLCVPRGNPEPVKQKTEGTRTGVLNLNLAATNELDLRGKYADEAAVLADKFLDTAARSGLHEVTIIHGKGTGALRTAITNLLKSHNLVKEFRLGRYGEGESGVTIVTL